MWDIELTKPMRLFARIVAGWLCHWSWKAVCARRLGRNICQEADFEDNTLTRDEDMWNYMRGQLVTEQAGSLRPVCDG